MPYSSYINEIIEKKPNWLIRYGIGAILFFLIIFLIAAWIIKYPDIISGTVSITTPKPPVDIIAEVNSPIKTIFNLTEKDTLKKGTPILLLESTTSYPQIKKLKITLEENNLKNKTTTIWLDSLGSLQTIYNNYALATLNYKNYITKQPYKERIQKLKHILNNKRSGLTFSKNYITTSKKEYSLKQKEYNRYETLFKKGVIAVAELEQIKQVLLQKQMGVANDYKNLNTEHISIAGIKSDILELELQKEAHEQELLNNCKTTANELKNGIKTWEKKYLIKAPISGKLSFYNEMNLGDFITAGEKILTIIPLQNKKLQAVGVFPVTNAGKIKKGQKVILKLDAYPYHEYGTILGTVKRISEMPVENAYNIVVTLPNGLVTNYEKKIIFKQRLTATANIITKDQSILQRVFYQFENLFKN